MRTLFLAASVLTLACGGAERTPLAPASPEVAPPAAPSALLPSPVAAAPTGVPQEVPVPPAAPAAPTAVRGSVEAANGFAFRMFARARKSDSANVFVGPASLRTVLAMTALGAKATTMSELSATLGLNDDPAKIAEDAREEDAALVRARGKGAQLFSANRLFGAKAFHTLPTFNALAGRGFGADLELLDFGESEKARGTVNRWVSEHTASKIPTLLPEGSVDGDTRMVLANAMYFKGTWAAKFKPALTRADPFYGDSAASPAMVPTMHRKGAMTAGAFPGGKILELPYDRTDLAMDIVLPDDKKGLEALEANLDAAVFTQWTRYLSGMTVDLSLPKFKMDWGGPVSRDLQALGIHAAFSSREAPIADFTGIAPPNPAGPLFISGVFHRAFVSIDEAGTEAAAASAVVTTMITSVEPVPQTMVFKADHPFLFIIRDTKKGRILFMGHYRDPRV